MRSFWVRLHRWAGLATALFLAVAGITGAVLAFRLELESWLNPELFLSAHTGPAISADEMVRRIEASDPAVRVTYLMLPKQPGETYSAYVSPRRREQPPGYNQVFADPVTGEMLGTRERGACCLERRNLVPFLTRLHYSLQIPLPWGRWFMGVVAVVWTLDCFIGLYLTFPRARPFLRKWGIAWRLKSGASAARLVFDLHRASGLWLWLVLLAVAVSSVELNLRHEVFNPVVSAFSPMTKPATEAPDPERRARAAGSPLSFGEIRERADATAISRGWTERTSGVLHQPARGLYVAFLRPSHYDTGRGFGAPVLHFDAGTGELLHASVPGEGSAGDLFSQLQFPLHSGHVAGLPGRIAVAASGVAVAVLSVTGILIWLRKRAGRASHSRPRRHAPGADPAK